MTLHKHWVAGWCSLSLVIEGWSWGSPKLCLIWSTPYKEHQAAVVSCSRVYLSGFVKISYFCWRGSFETFGDSQCKAAKGRAWCFSCWTRGSAMSHFFNYGRRFAEISRVVCCSSQKRGGLRGLVLGKRDVLSVPSHRRSVTELESVMTVLSWHVMTVFFNVHCFPRSWFDWPQL